MNTIAAVIVRLICGIITLAAWIFLLLIVVAVKGSAPLTTIHSGSTIEP